jgi:septum site-determining protein MinD
MARVLTVVSGKGGVGKTTTAINLGAALNKLNKEVIIVDANLNTPNVGVSLGAPIVPVSLNHILKGKADVNDAIYEHYSGTKILPSALSVKELTRFNTKKLPELTNKLKKISDFVIFDSAAGFGEELIDTLKASEEIIVVTNPEMLAVTDALKTIRVARGMGKDVKGVIVTKVRGKKYEMSFPSIKSMLETPIIGVVPDEDSVRESLNKRDAVVHTHPKSKAAKKYREIAMKIAGTKQDKKKGFLNRFKFWETGINDIFNGFGK